MGDTQLVQQLLAKGADPTAESKALLSAAISSNPLLLQANRSNANYPIRAAISKSQTDYIKELLADKRIDPSVDKNNLIGWAATWGLKDIVELLLNDERVDPSANKNAPIRWAAERGHIEVVKLLLNHPNVNPNDANDGALLFAAQNGHADIVELLINNPKVKPEGDNLALALDYAIKSGHSAVVTLLLKNNTDPTVVDTAIQTANDYFQPELAKLLIQNRDTEIATEQLRQAVERYNVEAVKSLLEDKQADPRAVKNNNLIGWAATWGLKDIVELLLKDERVNSNANNNAALVIAAEKGHADIVEVLLKNIMDPKVIEKAIQTAKDYSQPEVVKMLATNQLFLAIMRGEAESVKLLLDDGQADPCANNNQAITDAALFGYTKIVELLVNNPNVNPGARNNAALHSAVKKGHIDVVKKLLADERVDPLARYYGNVVQVAADNGHKDIVQLLLLDERIIPSPDKFVQTAFDKIPNMVFSRALGKKPINEAKMLRVGYQPIIPAKAPELGPIKVISNNEVYIDEKFSGEHVRGNRLLLNNDTPIGYNIHLPPDGVEIKNVIVKVYGGNLATDREKSAYRAGSLDILEKNLLKEGTAVITLNLPDLLELDVFQDRMDQKLHEKIHKCIHEFHKTLKNNPESLHPELAKLKGIESFLSGASFGGLNAVYHAEHYPKTFKGYISHNGALNNDRDLDRDGRIFNSERNPANQVNMDKIEDPLLLLVTQGDNNVAIEMNFDFYNRLNPEQKKNVQIGMTSRGNAGLDNKGHFVPSDSDELEGYIISLSAFMKNVKNAPDMPVLSQTKSKWHAFREEIESKKYNKKATLEDKFIAHALSAENSDAGKSSKSHEGKDRDKVVEDVIKENWSTVFQPIFTSLWVANEATQNAQSYISEIKENLKNGELLTDEVIVKFLESQSNILKEFFEDSHTEVLQIVPDFDYLKNLKDPKLLEATRKLFTEPTQPFNQKKQAYLLQALYQANPTLLEAHQQRLNKNSDYNAAHDQAKVKVIDASIKDSQLKREVWKEAKTELMKKMKEEGKNQDARASSISHAQNLASSKHQADKEGVSPPQAPAIADDKENKGPSIQ